MTTVGFDRRYGTYEGTTLSLCIGAFEMLAYVLIIAATVKRGVYQYRSWWKWNGEYEAVKVMNIRDGRLSQEELLCLLLGSGCWRAPPSGRRPWRYRSLWAGEASATWKTQRTWGPGK